MPRELETLAPVEQDVFTVPRYPRAALDHHNRCRDGVQPVNVAFVQRKLCATSLFARKFPCVVFVNVECHFVDSHVNRASLRRPPVFAQEVVASEMLPACDLLDAVEQRHEFFAALGELVVHPLATAIRFDQSRAFEAVKLLRNRPGGQLQPVCQFACGGRVTQSL